MDRQLLVKLDPATYAALARAASEVGITPTEFVAGSFHLTPDGRLHVEAAGPESIAVRGRLGVNGFLNDYSMGFIDPNTPPKAAGWWDVHSARDPTRARIIVDFRDLELDPETQRPTGRVRTGRKILRRSRVGIEGAGR